MLFRMKCAKFVGLEIGASRLWSIYDSREEQEWAENEWYAGLQPKGMRQSAVELVILSECRGDRE